MEESPTLGPPLEVQQCTDVAMVMSLWTKQVLHVSVRKMDHGLEKLQSVRVSGSRGRSKRERERERKRERERESQREINNIIHVLFNCILRKC